MATMQDLKKLGKDILKLTTELAIEIDGVEASFIDSFILRFPDVARDIFKELNNESLTTCRSVSIFWCDYLDDQKFCWVRMIQRYFKNMENAYQQWKKVFKNTPVEFAKEISISTQQFFASSVLHCDKSRIEFHWSRLHIAAGQGNLCGHIFEKIKNTQPRFQYEWTALHVAAELGHEEICEFLIDNLEDKNPFGQNGMTPFHYATERGLTNVCRLIIENIDDKNPATPNGCTPLHLAANRGHLEIIRLIVETGVKKDSHWNGKTPLDLVIKRNLTFYRLLSKDKFQLGGLIFKDLGIWLLILFLLCSCFFVVMLLILRIIGEIKFPLNNHDNDKSCSEFMVNHMWPMGTLIILVTAFLLTISLLIQPHRRHIIRGIIEEIR